MSIILNKMINSEDVNVNVNEDNKMISLCVQMNVCMVAYFCQHFNYLDLSKIYVDLSHILFLFLNNHLDNK